MTRSADNIPVETEKQPAGVESGRRRFLRWIWGGAMVGVVAEVAWLVSSFIRPRATPAGSRPAGLFTAGPVESYAPGSVTAFPSERFYLARLDGGGFLALQRQCTHLGCTVPWSETDQRFVCPCHASSFDITGAVLQAPATRPLDLFVVRIENGIVKVDLEQSQRRTEFRTSQVVDA